MTKQLEKLEELAKALNEKGFSATVEDYAITVRLDYYADLLITVATLIRVNNGRTITNTRYEVQGLTYDNTQGLSSEEVIATDLKTIQEVVTTVRKAVKGYNYEVA